jgi:hypothetical protein
MQTHIIQIEELKTQIVCLSETLVSTYDTTWHHNPEDQYRHKNIFTFLFIFSPAEHFYLQFASSTIHLEELHRCINVDIPVIDFRNFRS